MRASKNVARTRVRFQNTRMRIPFRIAILPLFIFIGAFTSACAATEVSAQTAAAPYGKVIKDVPYKSADAANVLDLYYPVGGKPPYPTHVYIHGGGWTGGKKNLGGNKTELFAALSQMGFLGVSVEYRLVDEKQNRYLRTCAVDTMDALRYLFAHAKELNIDPTRVFLWGDSAGGHLTLLCAVVPAEAFPGDVPAPAGGTPIKAAIACYPPTDMPHYEDISVKFNGKLRALSNRMGTTPEKNPALFVEVSPLDRLTPKAPPFLIFHGDADKTVNLEHSRRFVEKAKALGVPCELVVVKNANHGFSSANKQPISPDKTAIGAQMLEFFLAQSAKPAASVQSTAR